MNSDLGGALERLHAGAAGWARLAVQAKIRLLSQCRARIGPNSERWTAVASRIKAIGGSANEGEEAMTGPWGALCAFDAYIATLKEIARYGEPRTDRRRVRMRAGGQLAVEVFPADLRDRLLLGGVRAEVWMAPGIRQDELYLRIDAPGRVCLVLGAGNVTSIALLDVLYKLVAENSVCFLKVHALLSPLTPVLQDVLAPLVDSGYLSVASGGAAEGAYLCEHPLVDAIHITGSAATYRSIAQSTAKPITSELGNVSPAIVLPGRWSERDIEFVAEQIVSAKLHNDGCNCIALQVLVLSTQWPQRAALLAAIARLMRRADERPAYYPGSVQRFASFAAGRGTVRSYGHSDAEHIAPSIAEVDAADVGEPLFREEVFCPLLAATALEGDVPTYLRAAVRFCNDRVAGNLAANIFADSVTMRQWAHEIEAAVAELRYGCVGVNVWSGVAFLLPALPWGGFSGNTPERIGSGIGVVHNTRLFARPQKSVLYGPFRPFPRRLKPPWFVTQRHRAQIGEALCRYQDRGSPFALARIAWLSLRG